MERYQVELDAPGSGRPGTDIRYGHWGRPVLVFPSEQGRAWDYENNGMVDAVADLIEGGRCKLYCVDSFDAQTWSDSSIPIEERARRHSGYASWILDRVVPFIGSDSPGSGDAVVTGCSMGAYHALQFALTRAGLFPVALCQSGNYDPSQWSGWGARGEAAYFTNPSDYVGNLHGDHLDWLRGGCTSSWWSARDRGRSTRPARCRLLGTWPGCSPTGASRTSSTCGATTPPTTGTDGPSRSHTTCRGSSEGPAPWSDGGADRPARISERAGGT